MRPCSFGFRIWIHIILDRFLRTGARRSFERDCAFGLAHVTSWVPGGRAPMAPNPMNPSREVNPHGQFGVSRNKGVPV